MNIWKADTRPSEESLSLLEKEGAELPACHLISRTSNLGLPLKRPLQNLCQDSQCYTGKVSWSLSSHEKALMESQKNSGWKGLLEVIWFIQLLKPEQAAKSDRVAQGFCPVKFWVTPWTYTPKSLSAPLPVWPLSQCRIFFFTSNCNFLCCNLCPRQLKTAIRSPPA